MAHTPGWVAFDGQPLATPRSPRLDELSVNWAAGHGSSDATLIGVLDIAAELFDGWVWACVIDAQPGARVLHSSGLSLEAVEGVLATRDAATRAFVVPDAGGREVAIMGIGPSAAVTPEADVVIDAVARHLEVFRQA